MLQNSIKVVEPLRGRQLMLSLNEWLHQHYLLTQIVPYTADVFVFTYPVYLVGLYLWGINKKKTYYKEAALGVFFSAATAAVINMVIQFFGDKSRPEEALTSAQDLILYHLPTDPFPSDHAAVSAAIAMSTMLWGQKHKDPLFLRLSIFFWIACGLMSVSRVAVAIHWPTDILVGITVGVLSALLILSQKLWPWLQKKIIPHLIAVEKRIFKRVFGISQ